jgi:hypothetical protein
MDQLVSPQIGKTRFVGSGRADDSENFSVLHALPMADIWLQ